MKTDTKVHLMIAAWAFGIALLISAFGYGFVKLVDNSSFKTFRLECVNGLGADVINEEVLNPYTKDSTLCYGKITKDGDLFEVKRTCLFNYTLYCKYEPTGRRLKVKQFKNGWEL